MKTNQEALSIIRDYKGPGMRYGIAKSEAIVLRYVRIPLQENQFSALVSLVDNIGAAAFRRSDILKNLNAGKYLDAGKAISLWTIIDDAEPKAVVRRRKKERALFFLPIVVVNAEKTP